MRLWKDDRGTFPESVNSFRLLAPLYLSRFFLFSFSFGAKGEGRLRVNDGQMMMVKGEEEEENASVPYRVLETHGAAQSCEA